MYFCYNFCWPTIIPQKQNRHDPVFLYLDMVILSVAGDLEINPQFVDFTSTVVVRPTIVISFL